MSRKMMDTLFKIVRSVFIIFLILALFFLPAGTFKWPEAWILIVLYTLSVFWLVFWLKKNDPALLNERRRKNKDAKTWDRILILVYVFILMALPIIAGMDAVRFHWSDVRVSFKVLGFLGLIPGFILGFWAMRENTYLSDTVRIQKDRGHKVCKTGPYAFVRHPMYLGIIIAMFCLPLALGSLYAFIPSVLIVVLFVVRTLFEDRTLRRELPGYLEYASTVRFRLIPGVW